MRVCSKHSHAPRDHTELALLQHKLAWLGPAAATPMYLNKITRLLETPHTLLAEPGDPGIAAARADPRGPPAAAARVPARQPAGGRAAAPAAHRGGAGRRAGCLRRHGFPWRVLDNLPVCTRTPIHVYQALRLSRVLARELTLKVQFTWGFHTFDTLCGRAVSMHGPQVLLSGRLQGCIWLAADCRHLSAYCDSAVALRLGAVGLPWQPVLRRVGAPGVTHVVLPFGPDGDPDDGQEYMRTLRRECARLPCCSLTAAQP